MMITKETSKEDLRKRFPELPELKLDLLHRGLLEGRKFLDWAVANHEVLDKQYRTGRLGRYVGFDFAE